MFEKEKRFDLPKTIDEAADLLIGDLTANDRNVLGRLTESDFLHVYNGVAKYIIEEFRLWDGNDELLDACLPAMATDTDTSDPAKIILRRVWNKLRDSAGVMIIH